MWYLFEKHQFFHFTDIESTESQFQWNQCHNCRTCLSLISIQTCNYQIVYVEYVWLNAYQQTLVDFDLRGNEDCDAVAMSASFHIRNQKVRVLYLISVLKSMNDIEL
jgi:hypothetical protein